ncbi:MAG: hypothetical protein FJY36_03940 [Betaproteobacteria bacterium]|nr:hypothetical protein [Betaproteobacteria bacterium]
MTLLQLFFHLLNFMLPALAMAVCMPLAGRWLMGRRRAVNGRRRFGWHLLVGVVVLLAGVLLQGHDGTMATYAALVLVAGSLEWLLQRGWQGA